VDELARLTAELVAIDSVNPSLVPGGAGEAEIARFVARWLERAGLDVAALDPVPGRPSVVGIAAAGLVQDRGELPLDVGPRLARQGSPLGEEDAALRDARQLLAALDHGRMGGAGAEEWVRGRRAEQPIELLQADEDTSHADDRVDAALRARAVGRPAGDRDLGAHESAMRDREPQPGRLGDDRSVGPVTGQ